MILSLHLNGHTVVKVQNVPAILPFATHPPLSRFRVNGSHDAQVSQRKDVCISPQARNAIRVKRWVTAHQWHLLDLRLCNQQTIKRVTMMKC